MSDSPYSGHSVGNQPVKLGLLTFKSLRKRGRYQVDAVLVLEGMLKLRDPGAGADSQDRSLLFEKGQLENTERNGRKSESKLQFIFCRDNKIFLRVAQ